jgi:AraC-like DNA-binding protein
LYLAGFLFFSSFYVLENFYFFYGNSLPKIAFFTTTHAFFYLIGPFAYLYLRSFLKGNNKLSKIDFLHFALFVISFIGYIPYFFSSWEYKLEVAQNLYSENWDISSFRLNKFFYHEVDQVINVLHTYFYAVSLWCLIWKYKKANFHTNIQVRENKQMKAWVKIFASVLTIITINFTVAMASVWIYDDKSIFLSRAGNALLFASFVYIGMNMIILFFPQILYGIQIHSEIISQNQFEQEIEKSELQLFTNEYKEMIEAALETIKDQKLFLTVDYKLIHVSNASGIPTHHLTYFFNELKKISFSDWRNNLRIEHALSLIHEGQMSNFTLESISVKSGFTSQSTFIRSFKNVTGTTPSNYLKANF